MSKQSNDNESTLVELIELIVSLSFIGIIAAIVVAPILIGASEHTTPESVLKAAQLITKTPVVTERHFAWYGCSSGDVFKYDVHTPDGQYVGYVCKGVSLIPGLSKGATPRF